MPKRIPPLSARRVATAKASERPQSLFDGGGLFLFIPAQKFSPDGRRLPASKWWRFKYRFAGRSCMISMGVYPDVSLDEARRRRQEARELLARGINPSEDRKRRKSERQQELRIQENTLGKVAQDWLEVAETEWTSGHARTVRSRLERDILPVLGERLLSEITTPDVLAALRLVEARGAYESAHRIKTIISQIFRFAIVSGLPGVAYNPAAGLTGALRRPHPKGMAAILDPDVLGCLLRDIDTYAGSHVVRAALRLSPMLFVRPGELRNAEWRDIDLDSGVWNIPLAAMKATLQQKEQRRGRVHAVPLARQALEVLRELRPFTAGGRYVFPGRAASRVMSENTVNQALRTMGWDASTVTAHGFRATARTMLHETLGFSPDAIEAQLGHRVPDRLGTAYNRTQHLDERKKMMRAWADYLDGLKHNARP